MKKILLPLMVISFFSVTASSQVLKRLGERAKQKMENKAGDKIDKTIDDATDGKSKNKTGDGEVKEKKDGEETKIKTESKENTLKAYSKYDFVQGEKVVAFEDFGRTEIGDFPTDWNTNATAEVVTLNNKEGKWLKINKEGVWHPEFITNLPENFTLEFDLGVNTGWSGWDFALNFANLRTPQEYTNYYHYVSWKGVHAVHLEFRPARENTSGYSKIQAAKDGNYDLNNSVEYKAWDNTKNPFAHISVWRQKQRVRVYLNGEKIWDIPRAFDANSTYNAITFAASQSGNKDDYYVLGNIRLAVGAADTRNKLISEGKFVTTGITFDVNSDKIKPTSYGVLKEIATALKENPDVKVKIIGHTDSDGDEAKNLDLSKRRAASVRMALTTEFGIDGSRFETDGAGETKPVADNKTSEGKAQNRRVEFIKM